MGSPLPVRAIRGHLIWGTDGGVSACFWVEPFDYPHRSARDASDAHARTTAAFGALPRHSVILSVARRLSAPELERRIRGSIDPEPAPSWAAQARRVATEAAAGGLWERRWMLAIRLPGSGSGGVGGRIRAVLSRGGITGRLRGVQPLQRSATEAFEKAEGLEVQLSQHLRLLRPDAPELRWLYERAVLRGLADPPLPQSDGDRAAVTRLDRDAIYTEGGRPDDRDRPRHWRYLRVEHPDWGAGYQAFACLGEMPATWTFPYGSGEWLFHLSDQLPFPVDWAVRVEKIDNPAAQRRVLRASRNLTGQLTEPGGDPAGPPTTLAAAAEAVADHRARLEANPALPALRATTIVALGHRDLGTLERRARTLESTFRAARFNFYRPTGAQLQCLSATLPGSPTHPVIAEYAQDLLPDGLASGMPFGGSQMGDPSGMLLGHSIDSPTPAPVFFDPAHGPRDLDRSGSLAAIGELGAGKSFLAKTLAYNAVAMGCQVVAVDRTEAGEYAQLGAVVPSRAQVVEVREGARVCLDPFRVFDVPELRLRYGVGFLTLLTGTPPTSAAGAEVHRAASEVLERSGENGKAPRLADVTERLEGLGETAAEVAKKLQALAGISPAPLVFGDPGPPVDLTADYTCFHLPGLRLPQRGADREQTLPEELWGQAILYLVAACSRRVLFRHRRRFAALLLDEAHALTQNPQGRALVGELIRDGRKHFAAVWAFSQLATDVSGDDLDALLGYRVAFRQGYSQAEAALSFLGTEARPDTTEAVTSLGTGECLLRDPAGRLGLVRVASPTDPEVLAAFSTTPLAEADSPVRWPSLEAAFGEEIEE